MLIEPNDKATRTLVISSEATELLGVMIDSDLTWDCDITEITSEAANIRLIQVVKRNHSNGIK